MKSSSILKYMMSLVLACAVTAFFAGYSAANEGKTLVVYYSRDGHTKQIADQVAERFNADIERLVDLKKRTGAINTAIAGKDALAGNLTELAPLRKDVADYDIVLVGTPAWFSHMTPAVRTFLTQSDLQGKNVYFFATCHSVGAEKAIASMAEFLNISDEAYAALPLNHKDMADENGLADKINAFYEKVKAE